MARGRHGQGARLVRQRVGLLEPARRPRPRASCERAASAGSMRSTCAGRRVLVRVDFNVPLDGRRHHRRHAHPRGAADDRGAARAGRAGRRSARTSGARRASPTRRYSLRAGRGRLGGAARARRRASPTTASATRPRRRRWRSATATSLLLENLRFHPRGDGRTTRTSRARWRAWPSVYVERRVRRRAPRARLDRGRRAPAAGRGRRAAAARAARCSTASSRRRDQPFVVVMGGVKVADKIGGHRAARRGRPTRSWSAARWPSRSCAPRAAGGRRRCTRTRTAQETARARAEACAGRRLRAPAADRRRLRRARSRPTPRRASCPRDAIQDGWMGLDIGPRHGRAPTPRAHRSAPRPSSGTARWASFELEPFAAGTLRGGPGRRRLRRHDGGRRRRLGRRAQRGRRSPSASPTSRPAAARASSCSRAARCRASRPSPTRRSMSDQRTPLIAGNWKMFKTRGEADAFCDALAPCLDELDEVDLAHLPARSPPSTSSPSGSASSASASGPRTCTSRAAGRLHRRGLRAHAGSTSARPACCSATPSGASSSARPTTALAAQGAGRPGRRARAGALRRRDRGRARRRRDRGSGCARRSRPRSPRSTRRAALADVDRRLRAGLGHRHGPHGHAGASRRRPTRSCAACSRALRRRGRRRQSASSTAAPSSPTTRPSCSRSPTSTARSSAAPASRPSLAGHRARRPARMTPPVVLVVLDGWGLAPPGPGNAVEHGRRRRSSTRSWRGGRTRTLAASGRDVGLPEGQMGNSEVGHLNLGAGRVVPQDLVRLGDAVADGSLARNPALQPPAPAPPPPAGRCTSSGSSRTAACTRTSTTCAPSSRMAVDQRASRDVRVHAITDGRDVSPHQAAALLAELEREWAGTPVAIATVAGRYYAMDRDHRWRAHASAPCAAVVDGVGGPAPTAHEAVRASLRRRRDGRVRGARRARRPRARRDAAAATRWSSSTSAPTAPARSAARSTTPSTLRPRTRPPLPHLTTMTRYDDGCRGRWRSTTVRPDGRRWRTSWSGPGVAQLHAAETEKYPHVTYFFNGGAEAEHAGERRLLVPSPRDVATYDLRPEMSAVPLADGVVAALARRPARLRGRQLREPRHGRPHGRHPRRRARASRPPTRSSAACSRAVEAGGRGRVVTADHGNAEIMLQPDGSPHTAHTTNPVPVVVTRAGAPCATADAWPTSRRRCSSCLGCPGRRR